MILVIKTATSSLVKPSLSLEDPAQPWAAAIAAELIDREGRSHGFMKTRILGRGRQIHPDATKVHGISSRDAQKSGMDETDAVAYLNGLARQSTCAVSYSIDFDRDVIQGVLLRARDEARLRVWTRSNYKFISLRNACTAICRLKPIKPRDDGGFRWPSLDDACQIMLGWPRLLGVRDLWTDCMRVKALFLLLAERGAFEL